MKIISQINEWQEIRRKIAGETIGLVTTMGNLHAGHVSLCERAKQENAISVVTIFINPTQFNQTSDFDLYPRTIDADIKLLATLPVDYILVPEPAAMYPDDYQVQVQETQLSTELEGKYRPGHFNGMMTVVLKLLNLVQATRAYFGEKDFQQLLLVKKMVQALFIPTAIIGCETVRAADGLALSSRNSRLNTEQRAKAKDFPALLQNALTTAEAAVKLTEKGFKVDYVAEQWQRRLAAIWLDDVRLIDNFPLK